MIDGLGYYKTKCRYRIYLATASKIIMYYKMVTAECEIKHWAVGDAWALHPVKPTSEGRPEKDPEDWPKSGQRLDVALGP